MAMPMNVTRSHDSCFESQMNGHLIRPANETNQIKDVQVLRNTPPTQEFQALGYDRGHIARKIWSALFHDQLPGINPNLSQRIHYEEYVDSTTNLYGTMSNVYVWDPLPELENYPITQAGSTSSVAQQYVLMNVKPDWLGKDASSIRDHSYSNVTAYNVNVSQAKQTTDVYQLPSEYVQKLDNLSQAGILGKLRSWLIG